ncbi:hypothetical protein GCM10022243_59410 [Saccharothrix violaceirubra]|uniref:DNA-directed RNA polymerase specialized sigma24 family protein n=1 Tax=Saccharothrix violaceirubra TaxID=413306 RepID=A0A7W7T1S9_9PSEU|nr:hypothetical protein [Saccharothrix violaceirubra]MBB4964978.1 DNA-directed RNA polymerase specialized sigma24 family protein [Saccharothrix violaceirubra]
MTGESVPLTPDQAWQRCVRRRDRLRRTVERFGLTEHADDVVHDVFVSVMGKPVLHRDGFDALLDTAVWRRCLAVARKEDRRRRLVHEIGSVPVVGDHSDSVVDRIHAEWLLRGGGVLVRSEARLLALTGLGYSRGEIARRVGRPVVEIDRVIRALRRRMRYRLGGGAR